MEKKQRIDCYRFTDTQFNRPTLQQLIHLPIYQLFNLTALQNGEKAFKKDTAENEIEFG